MDELVFPSKTNITVRLEGGLGNQIFQYAFGRALADQCQGDLTLDMGFLEFNQSGKTKRAYSLAPFSIRCLLKSANPQFTNLIVGASKLSPLIAHLFKVRIEKEGGFDSNKANDISGGYYVGYWQSCKYFENIRETLYEDLTPSESLSKSALNTISVIGLYPSVGIHIRRGDYVSLPSASKHHGTLLLDYYYNSLELFRKSYPNAKFYIFTDDLAWCKDNFTVGNINLSFVCLDGSHGDWEDLWVMSHCNHHIIANSSFSWWAAWIADQRFGQENRFVCAPSKWFASNLILPADRFPAHWKVC